jgi:4-aminobutyrate aminotransferase/(S)-3-amino-2-methylpropionate transaminase
MDAWPVSTGEALHTQTFLGHPGACAAALASLAALEEEGLVARAAATGARALDFLRKESAAAPRVVECRGLGLMIGIECDDPHTAADACRAALARGVIVLPAGDDGRVLSVTPPLCIDEEALLGALGVVLACAK